MDFSSLLYEAQKNERNVEPRSNFYKTKFSPPKKVSKDKSKLSVNVQKFLEKQEEEEKRRKECDKKKLNELLTLRNQDKKSVNRVNKMLKLTKSANKSVLDEEEGDMITRSPSQKSKGSFQPDEDDYGYTSQAASSLYDKLMDKYSAMPEATPRFLKPVKSSAKNILDIKDRVKAALRKEEEDKLLPHKRKRKHKDSGGDGDDKQHRSDEDDDRDERRRDRHRDSDRDRDREREKEKAKRKPMPPPMDFNELLKLAEKKQHEPVVVEKKESEKEKKRDREPERLMTKKERREYEAHVERRRRLIEQEREHERQAKEKDRGGGGGFKIPKKNREETNDSDSRRPEKSQSSISSKSLSNGKSSSSSSKVLSGEELVEKLKKPSSVWSAPCNLTPPKLKHKLPSNSSSPSSSRREGYRNSPSGKPVIDSPQRNGYHSNHSSSELKVRNSNQISERSSTSSSSRKLPFKGSSSSESKAVDRSRKARSSSSEKYDDRYHRENSDKYRDGRDRESTHSKDRNRSDIYHDSGDKHRDRDRSENHSSSRGGKSRDDIERELLLEQFKRQQEEMMKLQEKLMQITQRKASPVPSKSDDSRRRRSPSPPRHNGSRGDRSSMKSSGDRGRRSNSSDRYVEKQRLSGDKQRSNGDRPSSKLNGDRTGGSSSSRDKARTDSERDRPRESGNKDRTPIKSGIGDVRKVNGQSSGDRKPNAQLCSGGDRKPNGQLSGADKNKLKERPTLNGRLKADLMKQPPKQFPPPDMKPKQFPPADLKPRQFPPPDVRRGPKKPMKRRIESDSEYDSELDDFIVDDDDAELDISKEISSIFGYDRNKYAHCDDEDDGNMESSFHGIEREEYESTKAGLLEDLEDIAKEKRMKALAAKRKAMKMKR